MQFAAVIFLSFLMLATASSKHRIITSRHQRALLQPAAPQDCACPEESILSGSCPATQAVLTFTSDTNLKYIACSPAPTYDPYTHELAFSACLRPTCLNSSFASGFTVSISDSPIQLINKLAAPAPSTLRISLQSSPGVTVQTASFTSTTGGNLPVSGANGQTEAELKVPDDGLASLSISAQVSVADAGRSPVLSLVLTETINGQPPSNPLPGAPPASDTMQPESTVGVVDTGFLAPFPLDPAVSKQLNKQTTLSVNGTMVTVTAGYKDYALVRCTTSALQTYTQILTSSGWQVESVSCLLNAPSGTSSTDCQASALLLAVTVFVASDEDTAAAADELAANLTASINAEGLGAACTLNSTMSTVIALSEQTDPSEVSDVTEAEACAASQGRLLIVLAESLSLPPQQLTFLPTFCSTYIWYPAPDTPPPPPDAPELVRHPYTPWKSALLGGMLGGLFLVQIIVLAVWVWHTRKEHQKAEAALSMAYQTPQHKYTMVDA